MNITQQQKGKEEKENYVEDRPQHERVQNPGAVRPVTHQRKSTDRHSQQSCDLRHTL